VRPLFDDKKYECIVEQADAFKNKTGKRLQRFLLLKSWFVSNYVSDWWEEYAYLYGRTPIMVHNNYYGTDLMQTPLTKLQAARAATLVHYLVLYREDLVSQRLKPMLAQNIVPLCSKQHERQFNTTRIPGETKDSISHINDSTHIAVYSSGKWYKLKVYYQDEILNTKELEV
jgi:carnitine O-palmitoyltransferase 1